MDISTFQSNLDFIKNIYFYEEWKDKHCRDRILAAIEDCNARIEKAFGESMHNLFIDKPSVEAVEKVVKRFPSTLSYTDDENGRIPIQCAATGFGGIKYVTILAKEGSENKVGGEDARGGLLLVDPFDDIDGWNTLQMLSTRNCYDEDDGDDEEDAMHMLKELWKSGLLLKEDIKEYELLDISCYKDTQKRFEYFASLDPDALVDTRVEVMGEPLAHAVSLDAERLILFMNASFKYHSDLCGLLFVKDDDGKIALDTICAGNGTKEKMTILYELLTPKCNYPILHHIFTKAPQHKDLFMEYFPWATQLRDHNGRSLQQTVLAAGPDIMNANNFLFPMLTDDQIREKDPITTLYPFAAMAAGEHADLKKSFYLLRRHPSVLDRRARVNADHQSIPCRRKKRKRGNGSKA